MADADTPKPAAAPTQTKAEFVRSLPLTLSPTEVVAKAKAAGIEITNGYVSNIRSEDKAKKKKKGAAKKAAKAPATKAPATKKSAAPTKAPAKPTAPKAKGKRRNRPNPKKDFIASQPASMPAMDVVAAAKKSGLVISKQYVYQMRSTPRGSKPAAAAPGSTPGAAAPVKRKGGRPKGSKTKSKTVAAAPIVAAKAAAPTVSRPAGASDMHKGLAQYVMTHGAQRVREALAEVEAGLSRVFGTT